MLGRSCACLLAISLLILAPVFLSGQSGRVENPPELNIHFPTSVTLPVTAPITPPARSDLRRPVPVMGTLGLTVIARAAGTIFSGTVTSIARPPATRGRAVETVAITFHIENDIRGATPGESLTILQWIGLWSAGQRYRVGERVLLFLYPPSKLGLTSCVAAGMGRFTVDPGGHVLLSAQHLSAFRADPVLGGKSRLRFSDFALAVRRAGEEE